MTTTSNGRAERKSLGAQLDRLDRILDGLADGLNEAVAAAVKVAVTAAVEAAVVEVLTSPELQARLRPEPATKPGCVRRATSVLWRGLVSAAKGCWSWGVTLIGHGRTSSVSAVLALRERRAVIVGKAHRSMTALARQVYLGLFIASGLARRFRKPLLVAAVAGTVLGVACYFAGLTVSTLVNGMAGFLGALVAGVLARLRPALRRLAARSRAAGRAP